MAGITLERVSKAYQNGAEAVTELTLEAADGEMIVLAGPEGCGKSTILRIIAGLEEVSAGEVRIGGRVMNHVEPKERGVAMVLENSLLYPEMTVEENVASGLKLFKLPGKEKEERIRETIAFLRLETVKDSKPKELSAVQKRRTVLARALVRRPQALLLDEPYRGLDVRTKEQLWQELLTLQKTQGITCIYAGGSQEEVMALNKRTYLLKAGNLLQEGLIQDLYERPGSRFAAEFLKSPKLSAFPEEAP